MKLLTKTIRSYLIYSIIVLLVSAPTFYIVIEQLFIDDVDEALNLRKSEVLKKIAQIKYPKDALVWGALDNEIDILPADYIMPDTIYQVMGYDALKNEPEPYRILSTGFQLQGKPYQLVIRISLIESEDLIESIAITQAILLLVLLGGLLFINRRLSKKIWKPFYDSLSQLKAFDIDKQIPIQMAHTIIKEFSDLNLGIKHLVHDNQRAYQSQKDFSDMAAHEMQTPLAILKSELEMLVQSDDITPAQAASLEVFSDTLNRLRRLNKSLLTLSRIDGHHFLAPEQVVVNEVLSKLLTHYEEQIAVAGISVELGEGDTIKLNANRTLIEILFTNLLLNAIRHNIPKGTIKILLSKNQIVMENTGKVLDIPPEKLFQRFIKDSTNADSIGLGLSIVQKICEIYQYRIRYVNERMLHRFTLTFHSEDAE